MAPTPAKAELKTLYKTKIASLSNGVRLGYRETCAPGNSKGDMDMDGDRDVVIALHG